MSSRSRVAVVLTVSLFFFGVTGGLEAAGETASPPGESPKVMRIGGALKDAEGRPRSGPLRLTFAIYAEPEGGVPLWSETQDVEVGTNSRYEVLLGSSKAEGFPLELLSSGQTRWLGSRVGEEPEQRPRIMLVSVAHALKADDAETLSGKALSDLVQVEQLTTPEGRKQLGLRPMATTDDVFTATADPGPGFISQALAGPPLQVSSSEVVANLNSDLFDGLDSTAFAQLAAANTFTADQTITGNLNVSGSVGIGTPIAGAPLDVAGKIRTSGPSPNFEGISNVNLVSLGNDTGKVSFWTTTGGVPQERMSVANDGTITLPSAVRVNAFLSRFIHNSGIGNTFIGNNAGNFTMTGRFNTASGAGALFSNTEGGFNTADGQNALLRNTTGNENTASGLSALQNNTAGNFNTACGSLALLNNTMGSDNTAVGQGTLVNNTTGTRNIAIGRSAGSNLTTGSDNICIRHSGVAGESNTIRIGDSFHTRTFVAGIFGVTTGEPNAIPVLIDSTGQLGTISSSARFKEEIEDMGEISSALLKLRPVTFRYKGSQRNARHFGLIAEEVEKELPELVVRAPSGELETVLYHEMPAMLLNELQKQQRRIEALEARLAELEGAAPQKAAMKQ